MKKILIFLFLVLIFCSFFICSKLNEKKYIQQANPIPKHLSTQYKNEIEEIINNDYPLVIKRIDNYTKEAGELKNKLLNNDVSKNNYIDQEYMDLGLIAELCIPSADLDLYTKIMQITQEKYLNTKFEPFATDNSAAYKNYLYPYFIDNDIDTKRLASITKYADKKIAVVKKYYTQAERARGN